MSIPRRRALVGFFRAFDLLCIATCFTIVYFFVSHPTDFLPPHQILATKVRMVNLLYFFAFAITCHIILTSFGLYRSRRLSDKRSEAMDVFWAVATVTLALYIEALFFRIEIIDLSFSVIFFFLCFITMILTRLPLRYLLGQIRKRGRNLRRILFVGMNFRSLRLAERIAVTPELGYKIIGFADNQWQAITNSDKMEFPLVSDLNGLPHFLRDQVVDEVVLALPVKSHYEISSQIISLCEDQGIIVRYLSDIFDAKLAKSRNGNFADFPMTKLYTGSMRGWTVSIKRGLDIFLSLTLIMLFFPLLLSVALAIKISSGGRILFVQERVGLNKRRFKLYKFRTMIPDAENRQSDLEDLNEAEGPVFKITDDPRITSIGKLLRKTSIDELPQLINVLKGDMSLVGPRPLPVRDWTKFTEDRHRRRFSVRPGMTCLWQINGRSSVSFDKWMDLDMEYIDRWSLAFDFRILLKTIPAVFKGLGAY